MQVDSDNSDSDDEETVALKREFELGEQTRRRAQKKDKYRAAIAAQQTAAAASSAPQLQLGPVDADPLERTAPLASLPAPPSHHAALPVAISAPPAVQTTAQQLEPVTTAPIEHIPVVHSTTPATLAAPAGAAAAQPVSLAAPLAAHTLTAPLAAPPPERPAAAPGTRVGKRKRTQVIRLGTEALSAELTEATMEPHWEVADVLDHSDTRAATRQFHVKWVGSSDLTWEPESNLKFKTKKTVSTNSHYARYCKKADISELTV